MNGLNEILSERAKTHGDFNKGASIFCDIQKHINQAKNLDESQRYALTMIATKLARILNGNPNEKDHWQDICGYAALGGRLSDEPTAQPAVNLLPVINIKSSNTKHNDNGRNHS